MKRRISIFTLLLCTFVGGLATTAFGTNFYVFSNKQGTSFQDWDGEKVSMQTTCPGDPWNTGNGPITANEASGLRFKGWYTRQSGWTTSEWPEADDARDVVTENAALTVSQIEGAGKLFGTTPVVVAKYVPTHDITGVASPAEAGKVTGGATVDEGGSVTLTATANTGWEFSQWSDGVKDNPRTISGIRADATYTATFSRLSVDKPNVTTSFTYDGTRKTCASAGSHYTVTGNTGTSAGDYTFTAKLEPGYTWSDDGSSADFVVKWKINTAAIESVALATVSATYDGNAHQPVVNSVTAGDKVFSSASAGWTVAYTRGGAATSDFTSAGTITVTVTGKDGLSGTASATFTIAKKTISTTGVGFSDKSVTYDGTPKSITVSNVPEGVEVSYSNNSLTDAGSQLATVNFAPTDKDNCEVSPTSKTATLTVNPAAITAIALSATSATYDGQPHQPTVVSVTANGKTFTDAAVGWDVAYDKDDFTSVGNIKVTATGKKNLTSSANTTFEIKSKSITVTFDPNGGNAPSPASKTVQCPGTYGTLPTCTRKGYRLTGWWTAKEGGTQITETTTVELTAAQTLYAQWEAKTYNLTIDPKGGLFNRSTKPTTFEGALTFDATNMNVIAVSVKEDGTPFLGYYTSGGVKVYDDAGKCVLGETYWDGDWPDGKYVNDDNLTVEARWSEASRYDISVEADPAKGTATGGGTFEAGTSVTLTATPNEGYAFCCWSNATDVVSTDNPYEFTMSSAAAGTYTAVFTGKVYMVTFMGVVATTPSFANVAVQVGRKWKDFFPEMTYSGHVLGGWYSQFTVPFNDAYKIDGEANVPATPPTMLFAKWDEIPPVVIYADPSYENTWITNSVDKGYEITDAEARTITKGWPARRGYNHWIKGWDPALPLTVAGDTTITAVWESYSDVLDCPDSGLMFDVRYGWVVNTNKDFCAKGDSCLEITSLASSGNSVTTTVKEPGKFKFQWKAGAGTSLYAEITGKGQWHSTYEGSGEWVPETIEINEASAEHPVDIRFTMSAQYLKGFCALDAVIWTPGIVPQKRTITVVAGEHGSVAGGGAFDVGADVTLTATADTGYAFCCWTNDTGFATNANPWTFKVVDDALYTATFTNCQYVVTLDPNGGTGGETSVLVTYDRNLPALGNLPHKDDGSSFLGYFDQTNGGTQYYKADGTGLGKWDKTNAATLYAQWKAPDMFTLTVTDDGHGTATKDPDQSQYVSGSKVTLAATANKGYAFEKWSDGSTDASRTVTVTADASYKATFTACVYRVTFDANGGTVYPEAKFVTYDALYGELPTPQRTGYAFRGWTVQSTVVTEDSIVSVAEDHTLVAKWEQEMGPVSAALDCNKLAFTATGGWAIETDHDFAYTAEGGNDSYLKTTSVDAGSGISATIKESGTLTFHWRAQGTKLGISKLVFSVGDIQKEILEQGNTDSLWQKRVVKIEVAGEPVTVSFSAEFVYGFCAVDFVTWTPDRKEPEYADVDTPVTGFSMVDGKIGFSFESDGSSTYHILGTNDVTAPWMLWPFVREIKAGETQPVQIDIKADEPKMFYRIRALK